MSVLHPGLAIAALAAVAVPILIHLLLRRRRRVIQWAAMSLLARAMRKDLRRQRVERWLLLASRCLLVALGGLALAQPFIGPRGGTFTRVRTLWLVIDDGVASAERLPDGGTALERSLEEARRQISALGAADRVGVITAAAPVRRLVDPPTADKSRVEALLSAMEPAFTGSDLAGAITEAVAAAGASDEPAEVILLSAFRAGSLDPSSVAPAVDGLTLRRLALRALPPLTEESANAWISEVEPLRGVDDSGPSPDRSVRVRIERRGEALPRSTRRITASGARRSAADATLGAGERRAGVELRLRRDGSESVDAGEITISLDEDAQPRDDRFFAVLPSEAPPRVLVLDRQSLATRRDLDHLSSGTWMARALAPSRGGSIQVDEVDPGSLDRSIMQGVDAIIVARPDLVSPDGWTLLRRFADLGGAVLVAPSPDDAGQRWVDRFVASVAPSWRVDPDVEAAEVGWRLAPVQPPSRTLRMLGSETSLLASPVTAHRRMRMTAPASDAEAALLFEDREPMLLAGRPSGSTRGWVMLLAVAPELSWTDLPARTLMVPLMQELVRQGRSLAAAEVRRVVGERIELPIGAVALGRRGDIATERVARRESLLPVGAEGRTRDPVLRPGIYDAIDERGRTAGTIAVNIDPARTSIEANDPGAVREWLARTGDWQWIGDPTAQELAVIRPREGGRWAIALLAAALVLALGEAILARLLSRGESWRRVE